MIHFETNSIINDEKSRYSQCIYISQKIYRFVRILPEEICLTIFFYFSICEQLFIVSRTCLKLLFVLLDRDSARVKLFKFQMGSLLNCGLNLYLFFFLLFLVCNHVTRRPCLKSKHDNFFAEFVSNKQTNKQNE